MLVKDQTDKKENGIYVYSSSAGLTRATDMATGQDARHTFTFVREGSAQNNGYAVVNYDSGENPDAVGTDNIEFALMSSSDIGSGTITTGKIADDAVTSAKIADDAVTAAKIDSSIDFKPTPSLLPR